MNRKAVVCEEPPAIDPHQPELDEELLCSWAASSLPSIEFIFAPLE